MTTVLHLDSSPRGERSKSRQLAEEFVTQWKQSQDQTRVLYRDLRLSPLPHVTETWVAAAFTPRETQTPEMINALQLSDELVDEFLSADQYLFSVPMYNFSIPSSFKAYIDHIVRAGRTFKFTDGRFQGLVRGKKIVFITARGDNYGTGSSHEGWDTAQEPALRFAFQFIGISDIHFIHANGLDLGDEARQKGMENARKQIQTLAATW